MEHTGEKQHICTICHKAFSHKSHLSNHERSHTGEKPFTCNICDKAFSIKSNLMKHVKSHSVDKPAKKNTIIDKKFQFANSD